MSDQAQAAMLQDIYAEMKAQERPKVVTYDDILRAKDQQSAESIRNRDNATARQAVTDDPHWLLLTEHGAGLAKSYAELVDATDRNRDRLQPKAFGEWVTEAKGEHDEAEINKTAFYHAALAAVADRWRKPVGARHTTSVGALNLATDLGQWDRATPGESVGQAEDAMARNDRPLMEGMLTSLRSGITHKNSWASDTGQRIGAELIDQLERATYSPALAQHERAQELALEYATSWRYLQGRLKEEGKLDASLHVEGDGLSLVLPDIKYDNGIRREAPATGTELAPMSDAELQEMAHG